MTKHEARRRAWQESALRASGISPEDCERLRRISLTLHRWHELECGADSGVIERDESTGKPFFRNAWSGRPFPVRDREAGALKRLGRLMASYPTLRAYVQGDPRGCALYILCPGDVPEGAEAHSHYSRGIAVY